MKLDRPLVFIDLETTGPSIREDRIVQIAAIKLNIDGKLDADSINTLVNPGISIPPDSQKIHNITDELVMGAPQFDQIADRVVLFMDGSDLAGYNVSRFDLPLLQAELYRAGRKLRHDPFIVDAFQIFVRQESRTLADAAKFYVKTSHENAHDAMADVDMSRRILIAQAERYGAEDLLELASLGRDPSWIDAGGRFVDDDGVIKVNFGSWKGVPLCRVEESYLVWMLKKDFDDDVRRIVQEELSNRGRAL